MTNFHSSYKHRSWYLLVLGCRMFVDSLDAQHYEEHHNNGTCYLSLSKMEVIIE